MEQSNKFLSHYGVLGMRWGVRKEDELVGRKRVAAEKTKANLRATVDNNSDILRKNKYAAVANLDAAKTPRSEAEAAAIRARNKKIAIGVGVGLTVAAGALLYAANKDKVDAAVSEALAKLSGKKPETNIQRMPGDYSLYQKHKINITTEQDAVKANFLSEWLRHDAHRTDTITQQAYEKLSTDELRLKAGQTLHRVTTNGGEVLRDGAYVSFDPDDANRYKAFLPPLWKTNGFGGGPNIFSMSMSATSELTSPSAKNRVDIFTTLLKNDKEFAKYWHYDRGDAHKFALSRYNKMALNLCDRDNVATKKYLAEVKRLGYNALVDDNDAGRLARTPLILLDVAKSITTNSITKLSDWDLADAANSIKPMAAESANSFNWLFTTDGNYLRKEYFKRFWNNMP